MPLFLLNTTRTTATFGFLKGIHQLEFEGDAYPILFLCNFDTLALRSLSVLESEGRDEYHVKFEAMDSIAVFHFNLTTRQWEQFGRRVVIIRSILITSTSSTRQLLPEFVHDAAPLAN
jgi:hypothetical protein